MDYAIFVINLIFFMQVIADFAFSFYAMFNYCIDKKQALNYSLLLIPGFMMALLAMLHSRLFLIELLLVSYTVHALVMIIGLFLEEKAINIFTVTLALILPPFMMYSGLLDVLYRLGFSVLGISYILAVLIHGLVSLKLHGADDYIKADVLNVLAVLALIFIFNVYGLSIMLALMALALIIKGSYLVRLSKAYKEEVDLRYNLIQEDFDEEVRKKVRTQLFYMEETQERMAEIAKTDAMTGAYNKKALLHAIEDRIADKRTKVFSILIFDIDKFKTINDTYGHVIGDKCIVRVARAAKESIREGDIVGRYGGDEFVVLLSGADLRTAIEVAHRLRKKVEMLTEPQITISIGISNYPADATNLQDLISHADAGLYQAKDKGRNTLGYISKKA